MNGSTFPYETKALGRMWGYVLDVPGSSGERWQRRRRGFATKREAAEALRAAEEQLRVGVVIDDRITFGDYVEDTWLPSIAPRRGGGRSRGSVEPSTFRTYTVTVQSYLLPRLGGLRLVDLRAAHINALYDELEATGGRSGHGLAPKTMQNIHGVLSKILGDATQQGVISRSPVDLVNAPTADKPTHTIWTPEQLRTFLLHVADDDLHAGWMLFATTGARRGEVAGLTWDDLDLDGHELHIDWTLGHVGHDLRWKPRPKSQAGRRTIALDPATVDALQTHRRAQLEQRLAAGEAWGETFTDSAGLARTGLLWTYGDGSPVHPKTWYERFLRLSADAGLPRIRLHDLRHSYATAVLEAATGWHDVKVLSQRLGHKRVGTTLDTYASVLPAVDHAKARSYAKVILGGPGLQRDLP